MRAYVLIAWGVTAISDHPFANEFFLPVFDGKLGLKFVPKYMGVFVRLGVT